MNLHMSWENWVKIVIAWEDKMASRLRDENPTKPGLSEPLVCLHWADRVQNFLNAVAP